MEDIDQKQLLEEDKKLAAEAAQGDQRAFTTLVERYRRYIYSIAYKISLNEEDALDISQNVLLRLVTKIGQFQGQGSFRGWLATITTNEAMSFLRKASRRRERATDPESLALMADTKPSSIRDNPRRAADTAQRRQLVEENMALLSSQQRAIFGLRFREEMPPREIAEKLGLPPGQVRSQLHRAIARLREALTEKPART